MVVNLCQKATNVKCHCNPGQIFYIISLTARMMLVLFCNISEEQTLQTS